MRHRDGTAARVGGPSENENGKRKSKSGEKKTPFPFLPIRHFHLPEALRGGPPFRFEAVKLGLFWLGPTATFVSCAMVWSTGVKVLGSGPEGSILAKMCGCVNALHVMRLRIRRNLIADLRGSHMGRFPQLQDT